MSGLDAYEYLKANYDWKEIEMSTLQEPPNREAIKAKRKAITYISTLCEENGVNPDKFDFDAVYPDGYNKTVQELNKNFMQWLRNKTRKSKAELQEGQAEHIANVGQLFATTEKATLIGQEQNHMRNLEADQGKIFATVRALKEIRDRMATMEKPIDWVEQVKNIIRSGFWSLHKIETKKALQGNSSIPVMQFITNDITLTNPQSDGRDFKLEFGRIIINLNRNNTVLAMGYRWQPFTKINVENKFHPYISADGAICFGNGSIAAGNYMATMRFDELFQLMETLLTTYSSDGGPYATMDKLFILGYDRYGDQPWLHALDKERRALYGVDEKNLRAMDKHKTYKEKKDMNDRVYMRVKCTHESCKYEFDNYKTIEGQGINSATSCPRCARFLPPYEEFVRPEAT